MSDISGKGHGDAHDWQCLGTPCQVATIYLCKNCSCKFTHAYHAIGNIFEAMKQARVPVDCVPTPLLAERERTGT